MTTVEEPTEFTKSFNILPNSASLHKKMLENKQKAKEDKFLREQTELPNLIDTIKGNINRKISKTDGLTVLKIDNLLYELKNVEPELSKKGIKQISKWLKLYGYVLYDNSYIIPKHLHRPFLAHMKRNLGIITVLSFIIPFSIFFLLLNHSLITSSFLTVVLGSSPYGVLRCFDNNFYKNYLDRKIKYQ